MFDLTIMKDKLEKCPECVSAEMNNGKLPVSGNPLVAVIRSPIKYLWPDLDREEIEKIEKHLLTWCDFDPGWLTGIRNVTQENRFLIWENRMVRDAEYRPKDAFSAPFVGSQFELEYYHITEDGDYDRAIETMVCETGYFPIEDVVVLEAYFQWRKIISNANKTDVS